MLEQKYDITPFKSSLPGYEDEGEVKLMWSEGDGYDWQSLVMVQIRKAEKPYPVQYAVIYGGGCSCNWFTNSAEVRVFEKLDEAYAKAFKFLNKYSDYWKPEAAREALDL